MSVLRVKDKDGNWQLIKTIKGDTGPQGPQGPKGEPGDVSHEEFDVVANMVELHEHDIITNSNRISRIESDLFDSGEANGKTITLEDSTFAEAIETKIDGEFEQFTTTGKNLFDDNNWEQGGIDPHTGKIMTSTTRLRNKDFIDVSQTNCYISMIDGNYCWLNVLMYDSNQEFIGNYHDKCSTLINGAKNMSLTFLDNTKYVKFVIRNVDNTSAINTDIISLLKSQLEYGNIKTSWEPYTGGQPSPNPDYPQKIKVIEDNFDLVSCGKNLFNVNTIIQNNYIDKNEDGSIYSKQDDTRSWIYSNSQWRFKLKAGTYTISFNSKIADTADWSELRLITTNDSPVFTGFILNKANTSKTFVLNEETDLGLMIKLTIGVIFVQIEPGDKATTIEEYQDTTINIDLNNEFVGKIDDTVKDTLRIAFNEDDGRNHLYLDKMIGKIVLDGSENWAQVSSVVEGTSRFYITYPDILNDLNGNNINIASNMFAGLSWQGIYTQNRTLLNAISDYSQPNTTDHRIVVRTNKSNTIDGFKTFLSQNKPVVYYKLTTPQEIDLGTIDQLLTYYPITNIYTTHKLQPMINVKYYRDIRETINNKLNRSEFEDFKLTYNSDKKELDNRFSKNEKDIDKLISIVPKKTATGTNELSYNNAYDYKLFGAKYQGNAEQDGTPTPDNPQEIKILKGFNDEEITIDGKVYGAYNCLGVKRIGKSLAYTPDYNQYTSGNGPITDVIKLPVGNYRIVFNARGLNYGGDIFLLTNDTPDINMTDFDSYTKYIDANKIGMKPTSNIYPTYCDFTSKGYVRLAIRELNGFGRQRTINNIMITTDLNATVDDYESYQEKISYIDLQGNELLFTDKIQIDDKGNAKLIKDWGKIVLTSVGWDKYNGIDNCYKNNNLLQFSAKRPGANDLAPNILCTHFKIKPWFVDGGEPGVYQTQSGLSLDISGVTYIGTKEINDIIDLETFNQFLNQNNIVVYYQLATPQEIDLGQVNLESLEDINDVTLLATLEPTFMQETYALNLTKEIEEIKNALLSTGANI